MLPKKHSAPLLSKARSALPALLPLCPSPPIPVHIFYLYLKLCEVSASWAGCGEHSVGIFGALHLGGQLSKSAPKQRPGSNFSS